MILDGKFGDDPKLVQCSRFVWGKAFKNEPGKICGRQSLKYLKVHALLKHVCNLYQIACFFPSLFLYHPVFSKKDQSGIKRLFVFLKEKLSHSIKSKLLIFFIGPPTPELVQKVKDLYNKRVSDVRFLIPVLNGLAKIEIIDVLPKLITQSPNVVKEVFNRLLGSFQSKYPFVK